MKMNIKKIILVLSFISGLLFLFTAIYLLSGSLEPEQWYELSVQEEGRDAIDWSKIGESMGWAIIFSVVFMLLSAVLLFLKGAKLSNGRFVLYYFSLLVCTILLASGLTVWLLPQS